MLVVAAEWMFSGCPVVAELLHSGCTVVAQWLLVDEIWRTAFDNFLMSLNVSSDIWLVLVSIQS